jgi:D-galactonate transporter
MTTTLSEKPSDAVSKTAQDALYRKVTWRIIPLLFCCFVMAYLDRINIGFAQLQMKDSLGFSAAVYGVGASIFFVGYLLFEVPSNLLLKRIGTRKTLLRIMFCWGIVSAGTMLVTTPMQFYVLRFLLGVFEAGFFPGIVYYLTLWYPPSRRAFVMAIFLTATLFAGIIGGPLSGLIMSSMNGVNGWAGWQWMFLLQGLPSSVLGVVAYLYLSDSPITADWLTDREKSLIDADLTPERNAIKSLEASAQSAFKRILTNPKVFILSGVVFAMLAAAYSLSFWAPTLINKAGVKDILNIGLISAIPSLCGAIAMVLIGRHSDKKQERRWHFSVCMLLSAVAIAALGFGTNSIWMLIVLLCFATVGVVSAVPVFWTIPPRYLAANDAAAGVALINSLGHLGGVVGPAMVGFVLTSTGSTANALFTLALIMVLGTVLLLLGTRNMPASS